MNNAFGATSTAEQVLRGVNLSGKRVLVTGVSECLGAETARALVSHGAEVVVGVQPHALDPKSAPALWQKSEQRVGERFSVP